MRSRVNSPASRRVGIAPHNSHVLPPNCLSGQVDRDSGAFYSKGLSKCCRSEYRQCAAKCHQDSVSPVPMASRSDSLVTSVVPTADSQWSFSIVPDATTEAPPVPPTTDSTTQRRPHPPCGFGITLPDLETMLGEVSTSSPGNTERRKPR